MPTPTVVGGRPGFAAQGAGPRPATANGRPGSQQLQSFLNLPAGQHAPGQLAAQGAGGQLSSRGAEVRANAQSWVGNFQNGAQPFSPAWFAQHPNAWQHAHPHADAWAVASVAATTAWLGWATVDGSGGGSSTTVYVEAAPAQPTLATAPPQAGGVPTAAAPAPSDDWLSLGVFALSRPASGSRQLVQLAVNRDAVVQGAYYDELLGVTVNVVGSVDRATQQVRWSPAENPQTVFSAPLAGLTAPETAVEVATPAGAESWTAVRLESPQ